MKNKEPIRIAHVIGKMVGGGVESFIMNYYRHIDKTKIQFDFIIDSDSTVVSKEEIEKLGGRIIEIPPYQKIFSCEKNMAKYDNIVIGSYSKYYFKLFTYSNIRN